MKKTKVCCFNVSDDIIAYLSESFDVYNGSLGKKIKVDNDRYNPHEYLLSNHDIPANIHEYRIIIDDMLYQDNVIDYIPEEHERKYLADKKVETIPWTIFAPVGLVRTWSNSCFNIFTVKAVVNVLPLVPVTTTT